MGTAFAILGSPPNSTTGLIAMLAGAAFGAVGNIFSTFVSWESKPDPRIDEYGRLITALGKKLEEQEKRIEAIFKDKMRFKRLV